MHSKVYQLLSWYYHVKKNYDQQNSIITVPCPKNYGTNMVLFNLWRALGSVNFSYASRAHFLHIHTLTLLWPFDKMQMELGVECTVCIFNWSRAYWDLDMNTGQVKEMRSG